MYEEKEIGCGLFYESLNNGKDHRVILQDGNCYFMTTPNIDKAKVVDVGRVIYYTNKISFGLTKFILDNAVDIDLKLLKENYDKRYNTNINIGEYVNEL